MAVSGVAHPPVDMSDLTEMQAVAALSRTVQNSLADMKRKILRLENEINNPDVDDDGWCA